MSITIWTRIEPHTRDKDMLEPLQARIHDPLWMLARQWQLGEFQGEDSGFPAAVRIRMESSSLNRYQFGDIAKGGATGLDYDSAKMPLETLVEREQIWPVSGQGHQLRLAAESGIHFFRLLDAQQLSSYKKPFLDHFGLKMPSDLAPGDADSSTLRFLTIMVGRVPDGAQLYKALNISLRNDPPQLPVLPSVKSADRQKMLQVAQAWLAWCKSLFSEPNPGPSAWKPERMEYAFAVAANTGTGEKVLAANEYQDGHLDWYSFNVQPDVSLGAAAHPKPVQKSVHTLIPTPVQYKGMPADRFWECEDAAVNFGAIETEFTDLSRLVMIDFALLAGNDWFLLPVEANIGTLCQIQSLVVTDTFGQRTLISPYQEIEGQTSEWKLFHIGVDRYQAESNQLSSAPFLFLPPSLPNNLESKPLEEVLFMRDEMANMAWAIEKLIENPLGKSLNRHELYLEKRRLEKEEGATLASGHTHGNALNYQMVTRIPDHWIPLVPVQEIITDQAGNPKPSLRLQRGQILTNTFDPTITPAYKSRLLNTGQPLKMFEEEVPRAGALVTRTYQYTRWMDGSTHLWIGRKKKPGKGEGWSGIRFDGIVQE